MLKMSIVMPDASIINNLFLFFFVLNMVEDCVCVCGGGGEYNVEIIISMIMNIIIKYCSLSYLKKSKMTTLWLLFADVL